MNREPIRAYLLARLDHGSNGRNQFRARLGGRAFQLPPITQRQRGRGRHQILTPVIDTKLWSADKRQKTASTTMQEVLLFVVAPLMT